MSDDWERVCDRGRGVVNDWWNVGAESGERGSEREEGDEEEDEEEDDEEAVEDMKVTVGGEAAEAL